MDINYFLKIFKFVLLQLLLLILSESLVATEDVVLKIDDFGDVTITNGFINVTFANNSDVRNLITNGKDLVDNVKQRTFYFDWNAGGGKFSPTNFTVITNTSDVVHIMYHQPFTKNHLDIDYHIQFRSNLSGFYQWLEAKHNGNLSIHWSEFRMIYRFNPKVIKFMNNGARKGPVPDLHNCPTIQDTTWQLSDGTYWSKYDYVGYLRETPWFGMYGGDVGAWVISPSREYHTGGPLKQDLLTQQGTLMCHYLTSSHFGTGEFSPENGWSKFYGPWLFYVNSGNEEEMLEDVKKQTNEEVARWPYQWVESDNYPLERGSVYGKITGQPKAEVVLHDSAEEYFELQTKGYLYHTKSDENGNYVIENVRPGNYVLSVYPLAGNGSENLIIKNVSVVTGAQTLEDILLPEPENVIWSIGEANRRSDNFRYSDELRNYYWHLLPPENLTYYIGKSDSAKDWYYGQTRNGTWKIVFEDFPNDQERTLRVAFAAASGSLISNIMTGRLQIDINGVRLIDKEYENDKTVYRGALQSGKFHSEVIEVPGNLVANGTNIVELTVVHGGFMYDAISYQ